MWNTRTERELTPAVAPQFGSDSREPQLVAHRAILDNLFRTQGPEWFEDEFSLGALDTPFRTAHEFIATGKASLAEPLLTKAGAAIEHRRDRFDTVVSAWSSWTNALQIVTEFRDLELAAQEQSTSQVTQLRRALETAGRSALSGEFETADGQFDAVIRDAVRLASKRLEQGRAETIRADEEWKRLFTGRTLPLLLHIDDIEELISEGDLFAAQGRWAPAWANYATARRHLRNWIDEVKALPMPPVRIVWENSLGMRFVWANGVWVSIWETRIMDFVVFVHEGGLEHGRGWRDYGWDTGWFKQGPAHPVLYCSPPIENLFCIWLTERDRQKGLLGLNDYYRLPTVSEWQGFAGLTVRLNDLSSVYPWGDSLPPPEYEGNYHWVDPDTGEPLDGFPFTAPVGRFRPNTLGLYDLWGNVAERCVETDESQASANYRVLGGSHLRWNDPLNDRGTEVGFRVVLVQGSSSPLPLPRYNRTAQGHEN